MFRGRAGQHFGTAYISSPELLQGITGIVMHNMYAGGQVDNCIHIFKRGTEIGIGAEIADYGTLTERGDGRLKRGPQRLSQKAGTRNRPALQ
jgi:hypothetical protein